MGDGYGQEIYNELYAIRYKLDSIDENVRRVAKEISELRQDMRMIASGQAPAPAETKKKGIFNL